MSPALKLSSPETHEFWEIPILFEDEHLLAVDKPARLLSSPDRYDPARPNLMRLLHQAIAKGVPWARERNLTYLANAHRLDFETTGIMLLARTKPALVALAAQFGSEKPRKEYVALVRGGPKTEAFEVSAKLAPDPLRPGQMRVDEKGGKRSVTQCAVAERFHGYTLLRCRPLTGRTHQIRVHLRWRRLPLMGDLIYGGQPLLLSRLKKGYRFRTDRAERPLIDRVALHAESLAFAHPVTGAEVHITSPWPKDLKVAIKYLRQFAPALGGPVASAGSADGLAQPPSSLVGEEFHDAVGDEYGPDEETAPGEV